MGYIDFDTLTASEYSAYRTKVVKAIWGADADLSGAEDAVDARISGLALSKERAVLASLAHENASLLDTGIADAVASGDRFFAWFLMRFRANSDGTDRAS